MSSIDAAGMASQLAYYEVMGAEARYNSKLELVNAQSTALSGIKTALSTLDNAIYQFTKPGATFGQSAPVLSNEDYFTVSTNGSVNNVNLDLFVEQTAASHQVVLDTGATSATDVFASGDAVTNGEFTFEQGGETYTLSFADADAFGDGDGELTLQEFTNYFNNELDGKAGASLVRSGDEVKLMITSDETGADNNFTLSANAESGLDTVVANASDNPLRTGRDAIVWLGDYGTGMQLTNSSNTFEDIVDGVDITLTNAQEIGDNSVNLAVEPDTEATLETLNEFVTAYNAALKSINEATSSGDDTSSRGVLASDGSIRGIESRLQNLMRQTYDGVSMFEIGLSFDKDGMLELDEDKFTEALTTYDMDEIFCGEDGLFVAMEDTIDMYTNYSTGLLSAKQERLDQQKTDINTKLDDLEDKYNMYYDRYLAQYTALNNTLMSMGSVTTFF